VRQKKAIIAQKPEALEALVSFDWSEVVRDFLQLGPSEMIVLDAADYEVTPHALRDMLKGAVDRLRYFYPDPPAATTHIDGNGKVLLMKSTRVTVVSRDGSYHMPRRTPYEAQPGERRIKRKRRRYEV
jgi:hypothetical protein